MNINEVIRQIAKDCGLASYLYARIKEANYIVDDITEYPFLWRQFNDRIGFTNITGQRKRTTTFHFLDQLTGLEPDTEKEVEPIVESMSKACADFLRGLKKAGCEVDMRSVTMTPTIVQYLDAYLAGVYCEVTITYMEGCNG
uniref:hypothetical protein n=1 Tax=Alistipes sp. TaxID=1872444 RepID=UPI004055BC35